MGRERFEFEFVENSVTLIKSGEGKEGGRGKKKKQTNGLVSSMADNSLDPPTLLRRRRPRPGSAQRPRVPQPVQPDRFARSDTDQVVTVVDATSSVGKSMTARWPPLPEDVALRASVCVMSVGAFGLTLAVLQTASGLYFLALAAGVVGAVWSTAMAVRRGGALRLLPPATQRALHGSLAALAFDNPTVRGTLARLDAQAAARPSSTSRRSASAEAASGAALVLGALDPSELAGFLRALPRPLRQLLDRPVLDAVPVPVRRLLLPQAPGGVDGISGGGGGGGKAAGGGGGGGGVWAGGKVKAVEELLQAVPSAAARPYRSHQPVGGAAAEEEEAELVVTPLSSAEVAMLRAETPPHPAPSLHHSAAPASGSLRVTPTARPVPPPPMLGRSGGGEVGASSSSFGDSDRSLDAEVSSGDYSDVANGGYSSGSEEGGAVNAGRSDSSDSGEEGEWAGWPVGAQVAHAAMAIALRRAACAARLEAGPALAGQVEAAVGGLGRLARNEEGGREAGAVAAAALAALALHLGHSPRARRLASDAAHLAGLAASLAALGLGGGLGLRRLAAVRAGRGGAAAAAVEAEADAAAAAVRAGVGAGRGVDGVRPERRRASAPRTAPPGAAPLVAPAACGVVEAPGGARWAWPPGLAARWLRLSPGARARIATAARACSRVLCLALVLLAVRRARETSRALAAARFAAKRALVASLASAAAALGGAAAGVGALSARGLCGARRHL